MLSKLKTWWRDRKEVERVKEYIEARPPVAVAREMMLHIFSDPAEFWSSATEEQKGDLMIRVVQAVGDSLDSQEPRMALRERLVNLTVDAAHYGALCFDEVTPHIMKWKDTEKLIGEIAYSSDDPNDLETVRHAIRITFEHRNAGMRAINCARMLTDDHHHDPKRDWFVPFKDSQMLHQRQIYWHLMDIEGQSPIMKELFIPDVDPLSAESHDCPSFHAFCHLGQWPTIIREGNAHPRMVWEDAWREKVKGYPVPFA